MPTLITQKRHSSQLTALGWSPDGTMIVSGGSIDFGRKRPAPVLVWDATTGERRVYNRTLPTGVLSLAWSPDGTRIAAGGWDACIRVWDWQTNAPCFHHHYADTGSSRAHMAWSPDGRWLATANDQWSEITIWDAATWQSRTTYAGHRPSETDIHQRQTDKFAWSPDATRMATITRIHTDSWRERETFIWETTTGRTLHTIPRQGYDVAWSPDSRRLAISTVGKISIWDTSRFELVRELESPTFGAARLAWSPTEAFLAVGAIRGKYVQLWNPDTGQHLQTWSVNWMDGMQWSPDGTRLVCGVQTGTAQVWQVL